MDVCSWCERDSWSCSYFSSPKDRSLKKMTLCQTASAMFTQSCAQSLQNLWRKLNCNCALVLGGRLSVSLCHAGELFSCWRIFNLFLIDLLALLYYYLCLFFRWLPLTADRKAYYLFLFLYLSVYNWCSFKWLLCHLSVMGFCFENAIFT